MKQIDITDKKAVEKYANDLINENCNEQKHECTCNGCDCKDPKVKPIDLVIFFSLILLFAWIIYASLTYPPKYKGDIRDTIKPLQDTLIVTATCYQPVAKQCDKTPHITANNQKISKSHPLNHRWIAVSRDLLTKYKLNYGDTVTIEGTWIYDGKWIVQDTMNKRFTKRIDFLIGKHNYGNLWNNVKLIKDIKN